MRDTNFIYFCDRLEAKKRQKKPEIKDPKLQELQERLEAKKAGKRNLARPLLLFNMCANQFSSRVK